MDKYDPEKFGFSPDQLEYAESIIRERDAEIERLRGERAWRPIETAPRPFIEFLGYFSNGESHVVAIDKLGECYRELDHKDAKWMLPTHWMPLPEDPQETADAD